MTTIDQVPGAGAGTEPEPEPEPDDHHREKLVRLGVVVAFLIALSVATGTFAVAAFVMAVITIVMLHEFGHFITAKRAGMKVTEYFLGFGPKLWSVRKGETEYGIKGIPLGGYVKIIGMSNMERDVDPADEPRTYRQQPYRARMTVALAGIFTHFAIAFLLLMVLWTAVGVPSLDQPSMTIGDVTRDSPAQQAGLKPGDKVLSIDGQPLTKWSQVRPYIRDHPGQAIAVEVKRGSQRLSVTATPATSNPTGEQVGFLGVGPQAATVHKNPLSAANESAQMLGDMTWRSVKGLADFFAPSSLRSYASLVVGNQPAKKAATDNGVSPADNRPVSIVGVGRLADQAAQNGAYDVIVLLILLNVFIGIFNLVPLLPLDGGHVAIATYERIRSRKGKRYHADVSKMMPVTAAVVAVLLVLGVTSIYLDIAKPIANPFQ